MDKFEQYKKSLKSLGVNVLKENGDPKNGLEVLSELSDVWNSGVANEIPNLNNPIIIPIINRTTDISIDIDLNPNISSERILDSLKEQLSSNHEHKWMPVANSTDVQCDICGIRAGRMVF